VVAERKPQAFAVGVDPAGVLQAIGQVGEGQAARHCKWYRLRYHRGMAMTLRLDEQETEALRARAQLEGRSMQEVARQAVRDYIEGTSRRELLDRVLDEELPRYAEALRRLGE
jgi:hypothetical protein